MCQTNYTTNGSDTRHHLDPTLPTTPMMQCDGAADELCITTHSQMFLLLLSMTPAHRNHITYKNICLLFLTTSSNDFIFFQNTQPHNVINPFCAHYMYISSFSGILLMMLEPWWPHFLWKHIPTFSPSLFFMD